MRNLETLPFTDRLSRIAYLLKHTGTVVGRDTDIVTPWAWMVAYAVVMVTAFFTGIIGVFLEFTLLWVGAFGLAGLMFLYKYFFYNYREMSQSWLVYETICGRDRSYADGKAAAKERKSGVRKLAGLDMLMAYLLSKRGEGEGWTQKLINLFLSGLEEVWDLVNHYMLPAIAIDRLTLTDGVKKMKDLRDQVPETLVGVFGIDFIGRIVGQVTTTFYLVLVVVAGGASYLGSGVLPEAFALALPENLFGSNPPMFNILPLLIGVYVVKLFGVAFERAVTSIKVIYFTIFYTQITHPDRIAEGLQDQLVSYLKMEEQPAEETASAPQEVATSEG